MGSIRQVSFEADTWMPSAYTLSCQQANHHTGTSTAFRWCRWRRSWTRRRWSNGYWSRGCRTVPHIQKQSKEELGFYLICYTSRCISNHLGKDWWPQRDSKSAYWKDDAMQDQLDVLSTKFNNIYTDQEHWTVGHSGQKGGDNFAASEGECLFEGEKFQKLFLSFLLFVFMFWIIVDGLWYTNVCF